MTRYLKLITTLYKYWLIRTLEFRSEVLALTIHSNLWGILAIIGVSVIFSNVNSIAGWTREQTLVLVTVSNLFNSLLWVFILPSLLSISGMIRTGKFDFVLLRPVNTRFSSTFLKFEFDNYPRILIMTSVLIYFLIHFGFHPSILSVISFLLVLILGIIIYYCLFFVIITLNFWFIKVNNIEDLFENLMGVGRYPVQIFQGSLKFLFLYIIPAGFVATFPTQFLIGQGSINLLIFAALLALTFLLISQWFWNFALKRYSSASS